MNSSSKACSILNLAEKDLRLVIHSLTATEPLHLDTAQKLLEKLVGPLGEIESSVRGQPSLAVRDALVSLRATLRRAKALSETGLATLDRQVEMAGLQPGFAGCSIRMEA